MFKMVMLKVETLDLILAVPDKEITYCCCWCCRNRRPVGRSGDGWIE